MWKLGPVARRRAVMYPVVGSIVDIVAALVAERRHPFFIAELLEDPALTLGMHENGEVPAAAEHRLAKRAPACGLCAGVVAVASEKPGAVRGTPARDHVAGQQDRLVVGQNVRRVFITAYRPQQHGDTEQAGVVDRLDSVVKTLEVPRVDPNFFLSLKRLVAVGVAVRRAAPTRGHPLNGSEALSFAFVQVMFPVKLVRFKRAVPRGVSPPEKRRAVLVHEVGAIARYSNRPMFAENIAAQRRGTAERAGEIVQAAIFLVGTGDVKGPSAGEVRQKSNLPVVAAIPEAIDLELLVGGRGEDGLELHILHRIVVRLETDQLALKAGPFGQERQALLSRCDRGGQTNAVQAKSLAHSTGRRGFWSQMHVMIRGTGETMSETGPKRKRDWTIDTDYL